MWTRRGSFSIKQSDTGYNRDLFFKLLKNILNNFLKTFSAARTKSTCRHQWQSRPLKIDLLTRSQRAATGQRPCSLAGRIGRACLMLPRRWLYLIFKKLKYFLELPDKHRLSRVDLNEVSKMDTFGFAPVNFVLRSGDSAITDMPKSERDPERLRRRFITIFSRSLFVYAWLFDGVSFTVVDFSLKLINLIFLKYF